SAKKADAGRSGRGSALDRDHVLVLQHRASLVPALQAARALCRRRSGAGRGQRNRAEIVLGQLPGDRLHAPRKRLDHGESVHGRRSLRTGFLRLGRGRRISHEGAQRLHGMAGAHDAAPDGAESRRVRAERFLNRHGFDIAASCWGMPGQSNPQEDQTMLSRRGFLKSTLGAGLGLATQGCQQMVAQPVRRRTIVDSQVHLWKAESADWPWVPGLKPQMPEPFTIEKLVPMMNEAGVDRVLIVPPSWTGDRNDYGLEAAKRYP